MGRTIYGREGGREGEGEKEGGERERESERARDMKPVDLWHLG